MIGRYSPMVPAAVPEDRGNGAAAAHGVETLPRFGLSSVAGSSGRLWVSYVTAAASGRVTRLMVATGDVAAVSCTLARMALFTADAGGNIALVARTANDPAIGAATFTPYERALATAGGFPSDYLIVRGRRYALGFLQVAGTASSLQGAFVLDAATDPVPSRVVAAQSDIAASYTVAGMVAHFNLAYLRGRP